MAERGFEVETVTIDSLGKFSLVKMDIEGAEGELIRDDSNWLNHVRAMVIEVHGERNLIDVPNVLAKKNFRIREMTRSDLLRNTLRNILSHPIGFLRAEFKTEPSLRL